MSAETDLLLFNGINASQGTYARMPISFAQLATQITQTKQLFERHELQLLRQNAQTQRQGSYSIKEGVDPLNLQQSGWALIMPHNADPAIYRALQPLLQLRQQQAGSRYREYAGASGYRDGESLQAFLARQGVALSGAVDPNRFPYYLLIAASPEQISFRFQYQLAQSYAVGRLHLPNIADYAHYARSVLAAEQGEVSLPRQATFFAPNQIADPPSSRMTEAISALVATLNTDQVGWVFNTTQAAEADKARLSDLLNGTKSPALLFSACHGLEFEPVDPRLSQHQGALLCQDWPGAQQWNGKALPPDFYFSAEDIASTAHCLGRIIVHFGSFSAGVPRLDDFTYPGSNSEPLPSQSFVAPLAQRLLAHPNGAALAVIGQVGRIWSAGLDLQQPDIRLIETFSAMLRRLLLRGAPIGHALAYFHQRYAELAVTLNEDLENIEFGMVYEPLDLARKWCELSDCRSMTLLGDPAVRLPLANPGAEAVVRQVPTTIPTQLETLGGDHPPSTPDPRELLPMGVVDVQPHGIDVAPPAETSGESFGLGELFSRSETAAQTTNLALELEAQLLEMLKESLRDNVLLEVTTHLSDQPDQAIATTRIDESGTASNQIGASPDPALFELHARIVETVAVARNARLSALAGLLNALRGER